jgi:hypothetical protein
MMAAQAGLFSLSPLPPAGDVVAYGGHGGDRA